MRLGVEPGKLEYLADQRVEALGLEGIEVRMNSMGDERDRGPYRDAVRAFLADRIHKMSELSQHLIVSNGNVTGVVDRLVADELAERQSLSTDRRAIVVKITESGRALMDEMAVNHRGWINDMFRNVSEADAARGVSIMLDIRHGTARD